MSGRDILGGHDVIVIGASAGGVEALTQLVAGLSPNTPASVLVVVHVPPYATSSLPAILSRAGPLPAAHAQDGEPLQQGRIYVAPPNHHLLLEDGVVRLSLGVRVNRMRPAVDPLFLSAAQVYGPRVVGVVLSGLLDDGTVGLMDIKRHGGVAVVQNPKEAPFPDMPQSAIAQVAVDHVLPASEIGQTLVRLVRGRSQMQPQEQEVRQPMIDEMPPASAMVEQDILAQEQGDRDGMLTVFTCPECGGSLWQVDAGSLVRFRCHTGHTLSGESLFVEQAENIEKSLWYAARSLRDKARLARQLAENARARGSEGTAVRFDTKAETDDAHAETLLRMIESNAAVNQVP